MSAVLAGGGTGGAEPRAQEMVSATLRICREHWKPLAIYGLLAGAPVAVLDAAVALNRDIDPFATPITLTGDASATDRDSLGSALLAIVLYAWASAATVHAVTAAREGRPVNGRAGLRAGLRRLGGVVAASIIVLALVVLGLVALVVPGLWIAVTLVLTTPALVLEDLSPLGAVRRSFTMVQGRWWKTAGVVVLGVLIALAALLIIAIPAGALAAATDDRTLRAVLAAVANTLSTGAVVPLSVGLFTVLFLERRGATHPPAEPPTDEERYRGFAPPVPAERVDAPVRWSAPQAPTGRRDPDRLTDAPARPPDGEPRPDAPDRSPDPDPLADPPGRSSQPDPLGDAPSRSDTDPPPHAFEPPREPPSSR